MKKLICLLVFVILALVGFVTVSGDEEKIDWTDSSTAEREGYKIANVELFVQKFKELSDSAQKKAMFEVVLKHNPETVDRWVESADGKNFMLSDRELLEPYFSQYIKRNPQVKPENKELYQEWLVNDGRILVHKQALAHKYLSSGEFKISDAKDRNVAQKYCELVRREGSCDLSKADKLKFDSYDKSGKTLILDGAIVNLGDLGDAPIKVTSEGALDVDSPDKDRTFTIAGRTYDVWKGGNLKVKFDKDNNPVFLEGAFARISNIPPSRKEGLVNLIYFGANGKISSLSWGKEDSLFISKAEGIGIQFYIGDQNKQSLQETGRGDYEQIIVHTGKLLHLTKTKDFDSAIGTEEGIYAEGKRVTWAYPDLVNNKEQIQDNVVKALSNLPSDMNSDYFKRFSEAYKFDRSAAEELAKKGNVMLVGGIGEAETIAISSTDQELAKGFKISANLNGHKTSIRNDDAKGKTGTMFVLGKNVDVIDLDNKGEGTTRINMDGFESTITNLVAERRVGSESTSKPYLIVTNDKSTSKELRTLNVRTESLADLKDGKTTVQSLNSEQLLIKGENYAVVNAVMNKKGELDHSKTTVKVQGAKDVVAFASIADDKDSGKKLKEMFGINGNIHYAMDNILEQGFCGSGKDCAANEDEKKVLASRAAVIRAEVAAAPAPVAAQVPSPANSQDALDTIKKSINKLRDAQMFNLEVTYEQLETLAKSKQLSPLERAFVEQKMMIDPKSSIVSAYVNNYPDERTIRLLKWHFESTNTNGRSAAREELMKLALYSSNSEVQALAYDAISSNTELKKELDTFRASKTNVIPEAPSATAQSTEGVDPPVILSQIKKSNSGFGTDIGGFSLTYNADNPTDRNVRENLLKLKRINLPTGSGEVIADVIDASGSEMWAYSPETRKAAIDTVVEKKNDQEISGAFDTLVDTATGSNSWFFRHDDVQKHALDAVAKIADKLNEKQRKKIAEHLNIRETDAKTLAKKIKGSEESFASMVS